MPALDHAYPDPTEGSLPLIIRLEAEPGVLRISVIDRGVGVSGCPGGISSVDEYLQVKRYRGLGTYIMQRFMDQVEFTQAPGRGTCVSMVKYLGPGDATLGEG